LQIGLYINSGPVIVTTEEGWKDGCDDVQSIVPGGRHRTTAQDRSQKTIKKAGPRRIPPLSPLREISK